MIGMKRLQRLAPDRREAQAALAADPLGAGKGLRRLRAMIRRMAAGTLAMSVRRMVMVAVMVRVRLHFRHVALRRLIGQRAAISCRCIALFGPEPKHFLPDCQEP